MSCAQRPATCWSTRAARTASPAATRPSTRSPATCPARATARFAGNLGARRTLPAAPRSCAQRWAHAARLAAAVGGRSRCAARASPPATTCSRWNMPDSPGRACTPDRGANGSAIRGGRSRTECSKRSHQAASAPTFTCKPYLLSCAPTWQPIPTRPPPTCSSRRAAPTAHRLVDRGLRRALPGQRLGQGLLLRESSRPSRGAART